MGLFVGDRRDVPDLRVQAAVVVPAFDVGKERELDLRPFEWRKKWEDDWENVKYCSERCRRNKHRDDVPWAASPDNQ